MSDIDGPQKMPAIGMIPAWVDSELVPVEKLEVHQRGLRHKAVSVFVLHGRDVLIQRRALGKYHTPGLWANTCCTHPHWDEAAEDCAVRRLHEELGITADALIHRGQVAYRADVGNGLIEDELVEVFTWQVPRKMELDPNPEEVMDAKWLALPELVRQVSTEPELFTPWIRIYLQDHADQIFAES